MIFPIPSQFQLKHGPWLEIIKNIIGKEWIKFLNTNLAAMTNKTKSKIPQPGFLKKA